MARWRVATLKLYWSHKKINIQFKNTHLPSIYTVKLVNNNCTWLWRLLHCHTCFPFYELIGRAWGCVLISSCATFLWSYFFSSKWLLFCSSSCQMSFLWQMFPSRKRLVWNTTSGRKKPCKEKNGELFSERWKTTGTCTFTGCKNKLNGVCR